MSVLETDRIDGLALDNDGACLRLMIADHLDWKDEYRHLMALQEKINGYISFCEDGQYQQFYKDATIQYAVFEIHFQHEPTPTALSFLERVQQQLVEMGITIECHPPAAEGFDDEFAQVQARLIDLCVEAVEGFPVEKIYAYCAIKDRPLLFQPYYIVKGKVKDLSKLTGNDKEDMGEFFRNCIDELKLLPAIGAKYNRPIPAEIKLSFDMSTYQFHAEYDDNPFFLCWETFPYAKVYHAWRKDVAKKTPRFFWQRKK